MHPGPPHGGIINGVGVASRSWGHDVLYPRWKLIQNIARMSEWSALSDYICFLIMPACSAYGFTHEKKRLVCNISLVRFYWETIVKTSKEDKISIEDYKTRVFLSVVTSNKLPVVHLSWPAKTQYNYYWFKELSACYEKSYKYWMILVIYFFLDEKYVFNSLMLMWRA